MVIGITGATGGLGRRMSEILLEKGYEIRCLVRRNSQHDFLVKEGIELVYGDICDYQTLEAFVAGLDVCIHLAAQVSSASKKVLEQVNAGGTKNVCEALLQYNPSCRFLYCSSIVARNYKAYKKPLYSYYTISKYKAEKVVEQYMNSLQATIIYPGYIYGHYDKVFMPMIIKMLKGGLDFLVKGGEKNVPIVFVDDLCELFIQSMNNDKAIGKKYVSLEENPVGVHDVVKMVAKRLGYRYPEKVYSKMAIRARMRINRILNALFKTSKPILSLREINILSNHAVYFNNADRDIQWKQKMDVRKGINLAVDIYVANIK